MNKNQLVIPIVVAIVFGGGGFYGGMTYAKSASPARGQFAGGNFAGRAGGAGGFRASQNGGVFGTIISKDANSITVQLGGPNATSTNGNDTGSKIVLFDAKTQVGKFVTGSASDLSVGQGVMVAGTPNSDGSVTAQMIQIRPAGQQFRQRPQDQ